MRPGRWAARARPSRITTRSANGELTADKLTAGASGGPWYAQSTDYAVTANDDRVASVYIKRAGGSDVTGTLEIWQTGVGVETSQAFTATAEWQRVTVYDSNAGATGNQHVRIAIDNANEAIHVWGVQSEESEGYVGPYVPTTSAAATLGVHTSAIANAYTGGYVTHDRGEVELTYSISELFQESRLIEIQPASGTADRKQFISRKPDNRTNFRGWDGAGVEQFNITDGDVHTQDTAYIERFRWESSGDLDGNPENTDVIREGVGRIGSGPDADWTPGTTEQTIYIGSAVGSVSPTNGIIARIKSYKTWKPE